MYNDKKNRRILMRDGTSVLSSFGYAKNIINGVDIDVDMKVAEDYDSNTYDKLNNTKIAVPMVPLNPEPESHDHTEEEFDMLVELCVTSSRLAPTEEAELRLKVELEYFDRTKNIKFLLKCVDLINTFRDNKVVWGVGRGSSCASYICYLLMINDIDPLRYSIPFKELSKEETPEWLISS